MFSRVNVFVLCAVLFFDDANSFSCENWNLEIQFPLEYFLFQTFKSRTRHRMCISVDQLQALLCDIFLMISREESVDPDTPGISNDSCVKFSLVISRKSNDPKMPGRFR